MDSYHGLSQWTVTMDSYPNVDPNSDPNTNLNPYSNPDPNPNSINPKNLHLGFVGTITIFYKCFAYITLPSR